MERGTMTLQKHGRGGVNPPNGEEILRGIKTVPQGSEGENTRGGHWKGFRVNHHAPSVSQRFLFQGKGGRRRREGTRGMKRGV